jgi:hypothetical protein
MTGNIPPHQQKASTEMRAERTREALIRKRSGMTYEEIWLTQVDENGKRVWPSRQAVGMAVHRAMQDAIADLRHETVYYRAESLDRLQALLKALWQRAMDGDIKAVTECRLIIDSISRLTGANAPTRIQIGESDVDATIRELDDEISRRARAVEGQVVRGEIETGPPPEDLGE